MLCVSAPLSCVVVIFVRHVFVCCSFGECCGGRWCVRLTSCALAGWRCGVIGEVLTLALVFAYIQHCRVFCALDAPVKHMRLLAWS